MPRIPSFPNSSCGAPHVPVSASEDIKLQIMAARLQEQLQNEFAEKADLKTINNESLLVSADGSSNININGIVDIKKTATDGLIDTYTITFTDASTTTFTVRNGQDGNSADVPTKVSELENDAGYITLADVPDVSNLATKEELEAVQNVAGSNSVKLFAIESDLVDISNELENIPTTYATKDEVAAVEAKVDAIVIPETDLSNYYNKTETENLIAEAVKDIEHPAVDLDGYATEEWVNEQGFLKEHQDLSAYATKDELFSKDYNELINTPEIPDVSGFTTLDEVSQQGYLLAKDIESKADKSDLENVAHIDDLATKLDVSTFNQEKALLSTKEELNAIEDKIITKTSQLENDAGFLTEHQSLENYVTTDAISAFITMNDVENAGYLKEVPDRYVTDDELAERGYITDISGKSDVGHTHSYNELTDLPEIPSIEGLASEEFVKSEIAAINIPKTDLTNYYTKAETAETIAAAVAEKANDIPFTTDKFVGKAIGGFAVGESVKGLTVAQLFAKLLELSDETEPKGIIETIIANKTPMHQVNELGELVEIPFTETLDLTADANVDATVSGFYQIKDETGTVIESGYQHDSAINDSMYYVIALPKELIFGENLSIQTWSVMENKWVEVDLEMSSDPVFIAEAFAEGGIPVPAIDNSIYTLWIDATLNTCAGTSYRFIINE